MWARPVTCFKYVEYGISVGDAIPMIMLHYIRLDHAARPTLETPSLAGFEEVSIYVRRPSGKELTAASMC